MTPKDKHYLCQLILKFKDQDISQEEQLHLDSMLREHPEGAELLMQIVEVYTRLMRSEAATSVLDKTNATADEMLHQLSQWENVAPSVIAEQEAPAVRPLIRHVVRQKHSYHINKKSALMAFLSMAAVLLIVLSLHLVPGPSIEVATLTDSMNAVFSGSDTLVAGSRLSCHTSPLWLQKGVIEITFDYGAKVVIEGPAEFQLNSSENIALHSGRLYAHVPGHSKGFMVETPSSRIIDLGTEFGVKVDFDGASHIYMMKGKASVFSGTKGQTGPGQILVAGDARRVDPEGAIETIPMRRGDFVRACLSEQSIVWRGKDIDLADIVGGGNGLGTGTLGTCIDTDTGEWKKESHLPPRKAFARPTASMQTNYLLHTVKTHPFIDGVFIPDNDQGPIATSTQGHAFDEFPDTSGLGWGGILYIEETLLNREIRLNNERYGIAGKPALFMHSNAGITFDLAQIRSAFSGSFKEFTAVYGIADDYWDGGAGTPPYADFWVLVDGQVRFCKKGVQVHQGGSISVELSEEDRFLTLVTTDGGQGSPEFENRTSINDWCVFGQPVLLTD